MLNLFSSFFANFEFDFAKDRMALPKFFEIFLVSFLFEELLSYDCPCS
jgi:hypothetical protein